MTIDLAGDGGLLQQQHLRLLVRAVELVQVGHAESEEGGNDDGRPQPGETVSYAFRVRNVGTADAHAVRIFIRQESEIGIHQQLRTHTIYGKTNGIQYIVDKRQ